MNDEDWLYARLYCPSVAETESFEERVAIKMENGVSEITARFEALRDLQDLRKYANRKG